jgi:hypothetical protein
MRAIERLFRWWSPKRYCIWKLARLRREHKKKMNAARSLSTLERTNLDAELSSGMWELEEWLTEIEDTELVRKARKMDVYLEDIPIPVIEEDGPWQPHDRHYRIGGFGNELLDPACRDALVKAIRERYPTYRKERREVWELWIKGVTIVIGLIGAATGLVAIWKK